MLLVKIAKYIGFGLYRRSYLIWSHVIAREGVATMSVLDMKVFSLVLYTCMRSLGCFPGVMMELWHDTYIPWYIFFGKMKHLEKHETPLIALNES